jgi:hypothetical protein
MAGSSADSFSSERLARAPRFPSRVRKFPKCCAMKVQKGPTKHKPEFLPLRPTFGVTVPSTNSHRAPNRSTLCNKTERTLRHPSSGHESTVDDEGREGSLVAGVTPMEVIPSVITQGLETISG